MSRWVRVGCCALLVQTSIEGKKVLVRVYQTSINASKFPTLSVTTHSLLTMYHKSANSSQNQPAYMQCRLAWNHKRVTIHDRGIDPSNTVVSNLQSTPGTN